MAVLLPAASSSAASCHGASRIPDAGDVAAARKATLCLLNRERSRHGLARIHAAAKLREAAEGHSTNMVTQRFFDHVAPGGVTLTERVEAVDYLKATVSSWLLAENIGWGSGVFASPRSMVQQWMHSPPHRANILNPSVRDAGVGIAIGAPNGGPGATYTLDLGRRN